MTLGQAHRFGVGLPATLALLAVLWPGELPGVAWAFLPAPTLAAFLQTKGWRVPPVVGVLVGLFGFAYGGWLVAQHGIESLVSAGTLVLVALLCARLVTRENLDHDRQAILLALLLLFAATVIHTELTFAPVFIAFSISAVWALTARQLVVGASDEAGRGGTRLALSLSRTDLATPAFMAVTAVIAVLLLASTVVLFVLFPRIGLGNLGFVRRSRGDLPQSVSLVGEPRGALLGGEVIARVRGLTAADFDRGLYLRGPVYPRVNRDGFERGDAQPISTLETQFAASKTRTYEVFVQPIAGKTLFSLGRVNEIGILAGGASNPGRRVRSFYLPSVPDLHAAEALTGPVRYQLTGTVLHAAEVDGARENVPGTFSAEEAIKLRHYLQLPDGLDDRIRILGTQIFTGAVTARAKADAVRRFLRGSFTYTLEQPNGHKPDPLAGFLLEDRRGHCEYFATAFAVLMRQGGVPTRVVGGFQGGWLDPVGDVVVFTTDNAHAWVEWFDPGVGWVVDDATPPAAPSRLSGLAILMERLRRGWDDWVVEYNLTSQLELAERLGRAVTGRGSYRDWRAVLRQGAAAAAVLVVAVLLAVGLRRLRRRTRGREDKLAAAMSRAIGRARGEAVPPSSTLREAVAGAAMSPASPGLLETLTQALAVYEQGRFAGRPQAAAEITRLVVELERFK